MRKKRGGSRQSLIADEDDTLWDNYADPTATGGLSATEKRFLLLVERGDVASIKRLLEARGGEEDQFSIDCMDPLGRSALTMAIENENYQLIQLLLTQNVQVKDGLLHAIKEEYVEAVEVLLEWEEQHHVPGTPYSWEAAERDTATFTPDITPLILAAHKNNYEILKILLDRGATLPLPHHVKCGCDICLSASQEDSLRYSRSRINAYRALAAPSLICLSAPDPFLTAFELSWELRRLARAEAEFSADYNELRAQCQEFTTALLGHARTSVELQTLLNHQAGIDDTEADGWLPGEKQSLSRLRLAIKYKQKKFVAHPSVQQLLASIWYDGLPGFRRKSVFSQLKEVLKYGLGFPFYSLCYMLFPNSATGRFMRKPFVKFITHSSSYMFFLTLLAAASQRFEFQLFKLIGDTFDIDWIQEMLEEWARKERGALPGLVESLIIIYILGWVWTEIKELYSEGVVNYTADLWNVIDFISNAFYVAWFALRATAVYIVRMELERGEDPYYPREHWSVFDPMLLSEGMFGAAMIFSFLKLVHIFSVNPHLGPIQIALGRMIIDILKFFFIYTLVLFAFGCGLNQLLWYYAELERSQCYSLPGGLPDFEKGDSCYIWRRFANLFETSQSLFWASFGLVELDAFELEGIKGFTRFWALLMFGSYSLINVIVLLNMLIAMMSTSYQIISERNDSEWKFARSKLWISYFEEGATVPAPFNIIPTFKTCFSGCGKKLERKPSKQRRDAMARYLHISRLLVRRYVSAEETRKQDEAGVSEDDVNEIRQDISSFRFELVDILKLNGMRTPTLAQQDHLVSGRKGKVMERRLMKDFQIGVVENAVREAVMAATGNPMDVFTRIAQAIGGKREPKDWNALVRSVSFQTDHIGSKQTSMKRKSVRRKRVEDENKALFSMDPTILAEYNPKLMDVTPATRVAYAKFKTKMLISHAHANANEEVKEPSAPPTPAPTKPRVAKLVEAVSIDLGQQDELPILEPILRHPATPKLGQDRRVEFVEVKVEHQESPGHRSLSESSQGRSASIRSEQSVGITEPHVEPSAHPQVDSRQSSVQSVGQAPIPPQRRASGQSVPQGQIQSQDRRSSQSVAFASGESQERREYVKPTEHAQGQTTERRSSVTSVPLMRPSRTPSTQSAEAILPGIPERRPSSEQHAASEQQQVTKEAESRRTSQQEPVAKQPESRRPSEQQGQPLAGQPDSRRPSEQAIPQVPSQSQSRRTSEQSLVPGTGQSRRPSGLLTGKSAVTGQTRTGWL